VSLERCAICGELILFSKHYCHPAWLVWQLDDPERFNATTVYAYDPQAAVEKWADQEDSYGDYWIVQGGCPIVCVQRQGMGEDAPVEYHAVEGEMVAEYHAKQMQLADFKRELRSLVRRRSFWEAGRLYGQMHGIF
jgi:hypothetical protein